MSGNQRDLLTPHIAPKEAAGLADIRPERRRRTRTRVHWSVLLMHHHGADPVQTVTENLSSNGFYCISPTHFKVGESLICTLGVPAHDPPGGERVLVLKCAVEVVRTEPMAEIPGFGIACRIQDYHLVA